MWYKISAVAFWQNKERNYSEFFFVAFVFQLDGIFFSYYRSKMKWLYVFVAIFLTVNAQDDFCVKEIISNCNDQLGKMMKFSLHLFHLVCMTFYMVLLWNCVEKFVRKKVRLCVLIHMILISTAKTQIFHLTCHFLLLLTFIPNVYWNLIKICFSCGLFFFSICLNRRYWQL